MTNLQNALTIVRSKFYPSDPIDTKPCWEVNPSLWVAYCQLVGRPIAPSYVWTEVDVVLSIDEIINAQDTAKRLSEIALGYGHHEP